MQRTTGSRRTQLRLLPLLGFFLGGGPLALAAMEPQTSVFCMRDLLKTVLPNGHRSERLVRPIQKHILANARAFKKASFDEQVDYLSKHVVGLDPETARTILKTAYDYPGRAPNARVVFGGSRVRGNARPDSDLDLGFFGFGRNQVNKILKKINSRSQQGVIPIPVETTKIYEMNETPFIPLIRSPEEFFMRAGEGFSAQGKMKDFSPSGFISVGMDGTLVHVPPPGPGEIVLPATHSGWAKMYEKRHAGDFNRMLRKTENRSFTPEASWDGPAGRDPQLPKILMDLDRRTVWPDEYRESYQAVFGKAASPEDLTKFYDARLELYEDAVAALAKRIEREDPVLSVSFQRHFQESLRELARKKKKLLRSNPEAFEKIALRFSGLLGEMRAAVSLGHVKEIGVRLSQSKVLKPAIAPRLSETARALSANPETIGELIRRYPRVFAQPRYSDREMAERLGDAVFRNRYLEGLRGRLRVSPVAFEHLPHGGGGIRTAEEYLERIRADLEKNPKIFHRLHTEARKLFAPSEVPEASLESFFAIEGNRVEYLEEVRRFIESKEADLLLEAPDGKVSWVEVKANHAPIGRDAFHADDFGKSPAVQFEENLQIVEYLGLQDRVSFRFFVNGMEDALVHELKMKNVDVIQAPWLK